jgi:hypothetical protein
VHHTVTHRDQPTAVLDSRGIEAAPVVVDGEGDRLARALQPDIARGRCCVLDGVRGRLEAGEVDRGLDRDGKPPELGCVQVHLERCVAGLLGESGAQPSFGEQRRVDPACELSERADGRVRAPGRCGAAERAS